MVIGTPISPCINGAYSILTSSRPDALMTAHVLCPGTVLPHRQRSEEADCFVYASIGGRVNSTIWRLTTHLVVRTVAAKRMPLIEVHLCHALVTKRLFSFQLKLRADRHIRCHR